MVLSELVMSILHSEKQEYQPLNWQSPNELVVWYQNLQALTV